MHVHIDKFTTIESDPSATAISPPPLVLGPTVNTLNNHKHASSSLSPLTETKIKKFSPRSLGLPALGIKFRLAAFLGSAGNRTPDSAHFCLSFHLNVRCGCAMRFLFPNEVSYH